MKFALRDKYPIDTKDQLVKAAEYFDSYLTKMAPSDRMTIATNMEKQASVLRVNLDRDWIYNYSRPFIKCATLSPEFGKSIQMRKQACLGRIKKVNGTSLNLCDMLTQIEKTAKLVSPIKIMKALEAFDKFAELEYAYDNTINDPAMSVFGSVEDPMYDSEEIANGITDYDAINASRESGYVQGVSDAFGQQMANSFTANPVQTIQAMTPIEQGLAANIIGQEV